MIRRINGIRTVKYKGKVKLINTATMKSVTEKEARVAECNFVTQLKSTALLCFLGMLSLILTGASHIVSDVSS